MLLIYTSVVCMKNTCITYVCNIFIKLLNAIDSNTEFTDAQNAGWSCGAAAAGQYTI